MTSYRTDSLTARGAAAVGAPNVPRLFSLPAVVALTSASRASIYVWIKAGEFPKPIKLGPRRVAWREEDVLAFLASRKAA
jgi:prophage regulatory protein